MPIENQQPISEPAAAMPEAAARTSTEQPVSTRIRECASLGASRNMPFCVLQSAMYSIASGVRKRLLPRHQPRFRGRLAADPRCGTG